MAVEVLSHEEMSVRSEEDVFAIRKRVRTLSEQLGFDMFASAALTTATSELSRNALLHAGGGVVAMEELRRDADVRGLRVRFTDQGPGIPEVERVLHGGFSTLKSLGLGLSGSRRLVDEFQIETAVGRGTDITIVKWKRL